MRKFSIIIRTSDCTKYFWFLSLGQTEVSFLCDIPKLTTVLRSIDAVNLSVGLLYYYQMIN